MAENKDRIWVGFGIARKRNRGKGWKEIYVGPGLFDYEFECKDCGVRIRHFVVSPPYCPYCGKHHG